MVIFWIIPTTIQLLSLSREYFSKTHFGLCIQQCNLERTSGSLPFTCHHMTRHLCPLLISVPSFHSQCQITHNFCRLTRTYIPHICPTPDQGHKQALPGIRKRAVRYGRGCQHGQPLGSERPLRNVVRVGRKPTQIFFWNLSFGPSQGDYHRNLTSKCTGCV